MFLSPPFNAWHLKERSMCLVETISEHLAKLCHLSESRPKAQIIQKQACKGDTCNSFSNFPLQEHENINKVLLWLVNQIRYDCT